MNNDFYKSIISLLSRSDIRFRSTEVRPVELQEGTTNVSMFFDDIMNFGPTPLSKTPAISCLIVFALFDAYLENKYNMSPGTSFRKRYESLPSATNQNIVEKECYRLMKTIRNGFVHNINSIASVNDIFHFNYRSPQGTSFNLDIKSDKLELLYSIILLLVEGHYTINTIGHFENIICTYYNDLKEYVDRDGNFTDDGDIGSGSANSFNLASTSAHFKFNTVVRYPVKNPAYEITECKLIIKSIYNPGYEWYSADYCVTYNHIEYIIPQEVLDSDNSLSLSDLVCWESIV